MKLYAVIVDGIVVNKIVAESKDQAELLSKGICVEFFENDSFEIGWVYNEDGSYSEPEEPIEEDLSMTDPVAPLN